MSDNYLYEDREEAEQVSAVSKLAADVELLRSENEDFTSVPVGGPLESDHSFGFEVIRGISEIPRGIVHGAESAVREFLGSTKDLSDWLDENVADLGTLSDLGIGEKPTETSKDESETFINAPESVIGNVTSGLSQFVTGFVPIFRGAKFIKGFKGSSFVRTEASGAVAAALVFDPHEERLSDLIENFEVLRNPITNYLSANPEDSKAEGRLKNALEGVVASPLVEGTVKALRMFRSYSNVKNKSFNPAINSNDVLFGDLPTDAKELRPTIRTDKGEIIVGKTGELHENLLKRSGHKSKKGEFGYVARDGLFLSRQDVEDIIAGTHGLDAEGVHQLFSKSSISSFDLSPENIKKVRQFIKSKPLVEAVGEFDESVVERFVRTDPLKAGSKRISINVDKLNSDLKISEVLNKTEAIYRESIDQARRGKISHKETQKLADDLGMTVSDLLNTRAGKAFNSEEATAARQVLVSTAEAVARAGNAALLHKSDENLVKFYKSIQIHNAVHAKVSGVKAESGRSLDAFKIPVGSKKEIQESLDRIIADAGGDKVILQMAESIRMLDTPGQISRFSSAAGRATTTDMVIEAWLNGLLSGPQTHAVNVLSNSLVAGWRIPERLVQAQVSKLFGDTSTNSQEALGAMFGATKGFKDGMRLFGRVLMSGEPTDALTKIEVRNHKSITGDNVAKLPLVAMTRKMLPDKLKQSGFYGHAAWAMSKSMDVFGSAIRIPGRLLMAEDEFFKAIGYRSELYATAYGIASRKGLSGDDFAKEVQSIINNPPKSVKYKAINAARYQTFTNPLGPTGQNIQSIINRHPMAKFIAPFVRTPINIFKFAAERTPFGLFMRQVRQDMLAGGARADAAMGKMAMGSMIGMVVMDYAFQGVITGGGSSDPELRAARRRAGIQDYSIRVGGQTFSFARLEPIGTIFGIAADLAEIGALMDNAEYEDITTRFIGAITKNVNNKTFVEGLFKFATAIDDWDRFGKSFMGNMASSVVPNWLKTIENINDPTLNDVRSTLDAIKSRIPGYSKDLPPLRNLWGDKIQLSGGLGPDFITPIWSTEISKDPVDIEILNIQADLSMPSRVINEVELTPHEYDKLIQLTAGEVNGITMKDQIREVIQGETLINGRPYSSYGDEGKRLILKSIVNSRKEIGRNMLLSSEEFEEDLKLRINEHREIQKANILGDQQ